MKAYTKLASTAEKSREEWLELRRGGLGGSDAGAIMGFNPYKGPFGVYINKKMGYDEDLSNKESVYWGTVLEDVVAKEFERRTGKKVRRVNAILQSKEHPFMLANLDREIVGEDAILECKTTSSYRDGEWQEDEIPASYICQAQHYMAVTGVEKAYIACLIGGQKFVWKEIVKDEEFIEMLIRKEEDFWNRYILGNDAPPPDDSEACRKYLKEKYPQEQGGAIFLSSDMEKKAQQYQEILGSIKELERRKERVRNELIAYMETAPEAIGDGFILSYKTAESRRLNTKKLKEEQPELYKEYTVTTMERRFRLRPCRNF